MRRGPVTGFPLPRYVSLGASEANARRGPSRSHRIDWVFTRREMPVMIVAEHGHWRRVVDRDGVGGWMHYSLLSGVRTAIVDRDMLPLYSRPDANSPVRARAELGVIGRLRECRPSWCLMEVGGHRGWVDQRALWGVEADEVFD
ncbi:SH3 domain-containing protein [Roseibacterium sp. SDUM158017]|nr:SH3 domain-containing protein [Roseibacterium sp. SDUM158017]MDG4647234.1 SH3 domain-containing protein [Roseibacterium sp. SDUM158017]